MPARKLSNTEKVAIVLLALGEEIAAEIFRGLDPLNIRRIGSAMGHLEAVDASTVEIVINEFLGLLKINRASVKTDGLAFAQKAIQLAFQSEASLQVLKDIESNNPRLRALEHVDPINLAKILKTEHPQIIALAMAFMESDYAAEFIRMIPESERSSILLRLARLGPVDAETIHALDQELLAEIELMGQASHRKLGGSKQVAAILNLMNQDGQSILKNLAQQNEKLAEDIKNQMFTFEMLIKIDGRGIQELVKNTKPTDLCVALRNCSEELRAHFLKNLSKRAGQNLLDDIQSMSKQKISDIEKIQQAIAESALKLEEEGKIFIERKTLKVV